MNPESKYTVSGAWMPTIVFGTDLKIELSYLIEMFKNQKIDARSFFYPLSSLPMFEYNSQNVNAYSIQSRAVNLPSYHDMTTDDLERVINTVKNFYEHIT